MDGFLVSTANGLLAALTWRLVWVEIDSGWGASWGVDMELLELAIIFALNTGELFSTPGGSVRTTCELQGEIGSEGRSNQFELVFTNIALFQRRDVTSLSRDSHAIGSCGEEMRNFVGSGVASQSS